MSQMRSKTVENLKFKTKLTRRVVENEKLSSMNLAIEVEVLWKSKSHHRKSFNASNIDDFYVLLFAI